MSTRKTLKRTFLALAVLLLVLTLLVIEENWRGKREWDRVVEATAAKGVTVDWTDYIPEEIPDELNLNKAPMIAYWHQERNEPEANKVLSWEERWGPVNDLNSLTSELRQVDLSISSPEAIQEFIKKLEPYRELIAEFRKACIERPLARMDGNYLGDPFSSAIIPFTAVRNYTTLLWAEAMVHLHQNRPDLALENIAAMRRLSTLNPQPYFLVNAMIEVVVEKNFILPSYTEGLKMDLFSDAELQSIMLECLEGAPLEKLESSFETEIAAGLRYAELCMEKKLDLEMVDLINLETDQYRLISRLLPKGWQWILFSRCTHYTSFQLEIYDSSKRALDTDRMDAIKENYEQIILEPKFFNLLAAMALPAFEKIWETTIHLQQSKDMCALACALELYHRAHGELPAELDTLYPDILPTLQNDPITAAPYHYERVNADEYRLWSVGTDRTNDNGYHQADDPKDNVWPQSTRKHKPREWICGSTPVTEQTDSLKKPSTEETLSIHFIDEDLSVIMSNVAELFNLNLAIPETFPKSHKTSIQLKDVAWPQLFDVLLEPTGYTWTNRDKGTVQIISVLEMANTYPEEIAYIRRFSFEELKPVLEPLLVEGAITQIGTCDDPNHLHFRAHKSESKALKHQLETIDLIGDGLIQSK
ncbi:hypothetical protein [Coraliomargarita parva]|uniref:hypothetical protein n=1 Tax=Coraliomargarita parva TaxID=3014050 RepID=UPI0022B3980F|nr:hypothetical protein [Coraliomargarita parva]